MSLQLERKATYNPCSPFTLNCFVTQWEDVTVSVQSAFKNNTAT